ncbi:stage III sporulation protein SpoIIIAB [Gracilibacillus sp. YIM 98692]|uniref:stage III sporulation protein SpoIIIAB n=1 Tax=Gracilibacillus sp. YIM 98692 TaxID=2663532 RepID=UPI0013D5D1FC|nr:stage III sporulation protein SpoIIIAB [Gracilibacillus sp. YIM 98692]
MKWFGALLIVFTLTWLGYEWSKKLEQRPQLIRVLKSSLQILEAEIVYSQASIMEACHNISQQIPSPVSGFFRQVAQQLKHEPISLYDIWDKETDRFCHSVFLSSEEKEIMKQFGRTLGQHDIVQQQKYIQLALTHLDRKLKEAEDMNYRYGKMVKSLGLLAGLFLAILLL